MVESLTKYITQSARRAKKNSKEGQLFGHTYVYVKDALPENVDLETVLKKIEYVLPKHLTRDVDIIYVGEFEELKVRNVNAVYEDGAIYVTNEQDNVQDMVDDIIHEVAHVAEEAYGEIVYGSSGLEDEFLAKRRTLRDLLYAEGYNLPAQEFIKTSYSKAFDEFLYKEVGYSLLGNLVSGLFVSPYGATSLREYFANGFEEYYLGDRSYLNKLSPVLFQRINMLDEIRFD